MFILKNFTYNETVQFNIDADIALPNRGPESLQLPTALFYQQQVFFADGPKTGNVVHVENGSWLNLRLGDKLVGSDATPTITGAQTPVQIAKQMSVPHGNSILALGTIAESNGGVTIPSKSLSSVLPTPSTRLDLTPYSTPSETNPNKDYAADTNKPLNDAVAFLKENGKAVTASIHVNVTTESQGGITLSIPFEERSADVNLYEADYWLLSTDMNSKTYDYLAYTQTINMEFTIPGKSGKYTFPHVTSNFLTRKP